MAQYADREHEFDASLGNVMGTWAKQLVDADLTAQQGWLNALQELAKPDEKTHEIPSLDLQAGVTGDKGEVLAGADVKVPLALAMMGSRFGMKDASLKATMNVSASTLDETRVAGSAKAEGDASLGWGPIKATVKISASFSASSDKKRQSDYRSTMEANLDMGLLPVPEPIARVVDGFLGIVEADIEIAKAIALDDRRKKAAAAKLIPAIDDGGGGKKDE